MGISIIIPLYNKAKTISRAIESALCQDGEAEVVVVDDGSTDGSGSVVESFKDRVTYIRQKNAGPSAARNFGAQVSRFPILTFLDADDEFLPGCLTSHLACRCARPGVKVTISPPPRLHEEIIRRPHDFAPQGTFYYSNRFLYEIVTGIPVNAICVDRAVFGEINGFDTELQCWEITDFMYRLMLASPVVGFLDKNYVIVHKDTLNSQFARMKTNAVFQKRALHNKLDRIDELPLNQKKMIYQAAAEIVKALLITGALSDAKEILQRTRTSWRICRELRELYMLSRLPLPLIRVIVSIRRLFLSFTKIASQKTSRISACSQQSSDQFISENSKNLSAD